MAVADIILMFILILSVPALVEKYLAGLQFKRSLRMMIILSGILWIIYSCAHELFYPILGVVEGDAKTFATRWYPSIVHDIESQKYGNLLGRFLTPGRWFYVTYQSLIYYFTGATTISILGINSFMAFWGSLTLTRAIYCFLPRTSYKTTLLPFFLIFTPSVVFWSSTNLKEALMFWAICQVFAFAVPNSLQKRVVETFVLFAFGALLGSLLRPHVIIPWVLSVLLIKLFEFGFSKNSIGLLFVISIAFLPIAEHFSPKVLDAKIKYLERNMVQIIERGERCSFNNSTFDYGASGPVPIFSGLKSLLFRPYFWQAKKMRFLLSALEIWVLSFLIVFCWIRMRRNEIVAVLYAPLTQVAILVIFPFCWLLTYFPNEGLIVRQRVQVIPALLVLLALPILHRRRRVEHST